MTREEKINTLRTIIQECEDYQWQRKETLFEIIKDLEQEPVLDMIRVEIIRSIQNGTLKIESGEEMLFRIIDLYKAERSDKE